MILIYGIMKDVERFIVYADRKDFNNKKILPMKQVMPNYQSDPIYNAKDYGNFETLQSFNAVDRDTELISFKPPHDMRTRSRLGNMYESDPNVKRIIKFFTQYVMGTRIKQRIVPLQIDTPSKREDSDSEVDKILGTKKHKKFKEFISKVDELSDVFSHIRRSYQQSFVYGTAVLWKAWNSKEINTPETKTNIPIGTPIILKPINAFQLGSIHVDVETFQPKLYEYHNQHKTIEKLRAEDKSTYPELVYRKDIDPFAQTVQGPIMLPFERLIVFDRENAGVTPDTYSYGMSPLLPLIFHSENIRRIDQKILPELNETQYAPVGIFTVTKESSYNLEDLAAELSQAGNKIVINDDVKYQEVKINNSLEQILKEKDVLKKDLLMGTGMPSSIFNSEEMVNRSTAEITVNIFQSVTLDDERNLINEVMWKQWYRDLLGKFFKDQDYLDLEIKVELEFPNRTFTPFVDKAEALRQAYRDGGISKPEWRVGIDFSPYAEEETGIPENSDQKSNFGNAMGGNPNSDGSGTPTVGNSPNPSKNNDRQGKPLPPSGNQQLQGNQNTVKQAQQQKQKPAPK
jgi:hypothetical protein